MDRSHTDFVVTTPKQTRSRATTVSLSLKTKVPPEDTNTYFDKNDRMQDLLQRIGKNESGTLECKQLEAPFGLLANQRSEKLQDPKNTEMVEKWDKIIEENEALKKDLENGKMDERKLRKEFEVESDNEEACALVDKFLVSKEKSQTLLLPVLSSHEEMLELFGGPDSSSIKPAAPSYWEAEVSKGRTERARLIKVGVDIPAVWGIEDALQEITADLYITFTWEVKAKRDQIWNSVSREFKEPVWKVRLRDGKLISNLKDSIVLSDEISCGNEKSEHTTIIQRITITANFSQNFNLRKFPFDVQKVEFLIRYWLVPYSQQGEVKKERYIFYEDTDWECRVKENALKPSDE